MISNRTEKLEPLQCNSFLLFRPGRSPAGNLDGSLIYFAHSLALLYSLLWFCPLQALKPLWVPWSNQSRICATSSSSLCSPLVSLRFWAYKSTWVCSPKSASKISQKNWWPNTPAHLRPNLIRLGLLSIWIPAIGIGSKENWIPCCAEIRRARECVRRITPAYRWE